MKNLINSLILNNFINNLISELKKANAINKFSDPEFLTLWIKAFIMEQCRYYGNNVSFVVNTQMPNNLPPPIFPDLLNLQPNIIPSFYNPGYQNHRLSSNNGLDRIIDLDGQIQAVVSETVLLLSDKSEDLLTNQELMESKLKSALTKKLQDLDLGKEELVRQELAQLKQKLLSMGVSIEVIGKYFNPML